MAETLLLTNRSVEAIRPPESGRLEFKDSKTPGLYLRVTAKGVRTFDIWGPNANVTFDSYSNAFAAALQNKTQLSAALDKMQTDTVTDMKKIGFKVTG